MLAKQTLEAKINASRSPFIPPSNSASAFVQLRRIHIEKAASGADLPQPLKRLTICRLICSSAQPCARSAHVSAPGDKFSAQGEFLKPGASREAGNGPAVHRPPPIIANEPPADSSSGEWLQFN